MAELAAIVIFVLAMLSFPAIALLLVRSRTKQAQVEADPGALTAWKRAEYTRLEREWMEAWVTALPEKDQEYIRKYDFAGWRRGPEEIEKEIFERLVHWERRRIENTTGRLM